MAIICEPSDERLCECGEVAEYACDICGCLLCGECKPELDDPDAPAEFCEKCL